MDKTCCLNFRFHDRKYKVFEQLYKDQNKYKQIMK